MSMKKQHGASRDLLVKSLDKLLNIAEIEDASANGLQVEGAPVVKRIGLAVDACLAASQSALAEGCQFVLAHHGLIWGRPLRVTGSYARHVGFLLEHAINLYAAHLPLDLHPTLGNNAGLARLLGARNLKPFGNYRGRLIGLQGLLAEPKTLRNLASVLDGALGGTSIVLPFGKAKIRSVAMVSGGAAEELDEAIEKGVDCYITGEPAHQCHHIAMEAGINVIFAGHYHTEKTGVQALGDWLRQRFEVETVFLDVPTLV